jgi:sirohydrochlorin cobaltochelatase
MVRRAALAESGLILLAHGSRSAAWRRPFDRLQKMVARQSGVPTVLAFGEFMAPDLAGAVRALAAKGVKRAVVVPLFLGGGAHVRSDAPRLAREAQAASGVRLKVVKAVGEDLGVLAAMARYCTERKLKKHNKIK